MKRLCVIFSVLACGWIACAQASDTDTHSGPHQPTTSPQSRTPGEADGFHRSIFGGPVTDQQVKDAEEFLKANSPNRYHAYLKLAAIRPRPNIQRAMVNGYLQLHLLQSQDNDLYQLKLQELGLEDKIFGIVADARENGQKSDHKALRDQLRDPVQELIEKRKEESQHRIKRMQQALDNEESHLKDLQTVDASGIDDRIDKEITSGSRLFLGIGAGGPNAQSVPPHLDGNPTTHSVDADQIPPSK